jgi:hypothetical protein
LTISSKLAEKGPNTKAIHLASYQSGKNDGSGWLLGMLWPDVLRPQRLVLGHLALAVLANQTIMVVSINHSQMGGLLLF